MLFFNLKSFAYYIKAKRLRKLNFKAREFENRLFELANLVTKFQEIFKARDFGGIINKTDDNKERGSIPYLLIKSHSISRIVLHKEVREFLRRLRPQR